MEVSNDVILKKKLFIIFFKKIFIRKKKKTNFTKATTDGITFLLLIPL